MFDAIRNFFKPNKKNDRNINYTADIEAAIMALYSNGSQNKIIYPIQVATVYTCIKILSETVGRLPLAPHKTDKTNGVIPNKNSDLFNLLAYHPNGYTSPMAFIQALEYWRNLKGESFARIHRNGTSGTVQSFELLTPSQILGWNIINNELYYHVKIYEGVERLTNTGFYTPPTYTSHAKIMALHSSEILHFRMITSDGISGITPMTALAMNINTSYSALGAVDNFYKNNAFSPKALKSIATAASQKALNLAIEEFNEKYAGWMKSGKFIPLPPNTELQDLQINIQDAEILNTVKFDARQISALYGVPEHLVGGDQPKFSNMEQSQLNYKINTIVPILKMYESEFELKLLTDNERKRGNKILFDTLPLIEADYKTQIEALRTLFNMGSASPNDIAKIVKLSTTFEGGDGRYIQSNMAKVNTDGSLNTENSPPGVTIQNNGQKVNQYE